jgi:hypothetical protein
MWGRLATGGRLLIGLNLEVVLVPSASASANFAKKAANLGEK